MKLNVGDYVRTKTGIHKIFEINENATVWKYLCDKKPTGEWDGSYEYTTTRDENIIKSAEGTPRGLLDLIEVGDYVNGWRVNRVEKEEDGIFLTIGNVTSFISKNETDPYLAKDHNDKNKMCKIESIVTKEQFESMKYVVKRSKNAR